MLLGYKKRFQFFFYKYIDKYKVKVSLYQQIDLIDELSTLCLYILYLGSQNQGLYYLLYCICCTNTLELIR